MFREILLLFPLLIRCCFCITSDIIHCHLESEIFHGDIDGQTTVESDRPKFININAVEVYVVATVHLAYGLPPSAESVDGG